MSLDQKVGYLMYIVGVGIILYGLYMIGFTFYAISYLPGGSVSGFFIVFGLALFVVGFIVISSAKKKINKTDE